MKPGRELDEMTAKYHFMVDSAQVNARERDILEEVVRELAAPYFIDSRTHLKTIEKLQKMAREALINIDKLRSGVEV